MIPVLYVIAWWVLLQGIGWMTLPLARRAFAWLPDRGYTFSKALGLLLVSYLFWLGASAGFWRNETSGMILSILIVAGISGWVYWHQSKGAEKDSLRVFLREKKTLILVVEVLFTLVFIAWVVLRAYAPYKIMETGGEKFMEIAFLNGILKSESFPPLDPWLSGFAISYYYFGYLIMALLTRLTGAPASLGFELFNPALFALTAIGAFGVVYNLIGARTRADRKAASYPNQPIVYGLLSSLLVGVMGNLEGILEAIHSKGLLPDRFWQWLSVPGLNQAPVTGSWFPGLTGEWWWWRASRVVEDIDLSGRVMGVSPITEFPFFSFLLGDNHPHVMGLPFVLLAIALGLNFMLRQTSLLPKSTPDEDGAVLENERPSPQPAARWWNPAGYTLGGDWLLFILAALILGGLAFLNTWDFPIYLGLAVLAYGLGSGLSSGRLSREIILRMLVLGLSLTAAAILLYVFFYVSFGSQASGLLPYVFSPTRLPQYLVMFGILLFIVVCFLIVYLMDLSKASPPDRSAFSRALKWWLSIIFFIIAFYGLVLMVLAFSPAGRQLVEGYLSDPVVREALGGGGLEDVIRLAISYRLRDPWLLIFLSGLIGLALANLITLLKGRARQAGPSVGMYAPDGFAFLLILLGLALTLSVEFVYLRDSFNVRMNTVFKFYYQGWVMVGCASAFGGWWLLNRAEGSLGKAGKRVFQTGLAILILAGMVYPLMAGYSRVSGFQGQPNLDGASALAANNPDDWAAIRWLEANVKGAPTILEAPGKSYNYEGRISAFTGLPALLGWAVHESQWRGNYDEQGKREPDIETIYTTHDGQVALELLRKWGVKYVVVGAPERNYIQRLCQDASRGCSLAAALRKFDLVMNPVFDQGQVTIYELP